MKKAIMRGFIILFAIVIAGIVFWRATSTWIIWYNISDIFAEKRIANLKLQGKYTVDTSGLRRKWDVQGGTPFICFWEVKSPDDMQAYLRKALSVEFPYVNFNNKENYLVIAFGSPLKEVKYWNVKNPLTDLGNIITRAEVTFEEEYHDNTAYAYLIEKLNIVEERFYVMQGSKKVFFGKDVYEINEHWPDGK